VKSFSSFGEADSCAYLGSEDCWSNSTKYEPGLGLTGVYYVQSFACPQDRTDLVYYKKGTTTWGTPLSFNVGIEEKKPYLPVKIISQPFAGSIELIFNYQSPKDLNIRIFNQLGQIIRSEQIQAEKQAFEIPKTLCFRNLFHPCF